MRGGRVVGAVCAALAVAAGTAFATSVLRFETADLVERAEVIVHGRCVKKTARRGAHDDIVTEVRVEVFHMVKGGEGSPAEFEFTVYGGILDGRGSAISGAPAFERGEEVLVFLGPENDVGLRTAIGLSQGKYSVRIEDGRKVAYRNLEGLRLVDPETGEVTEAGDEQGVPFDELMERVERHVREQGEKDE